MRTRFWLSTMACGLLLAGCGGSGNGEGAGGGGGSDGLGGRGGKGGGLDTGLKINANVGLKVIDQPFAYESNLEGRISLTRHYETVVDGEISVNGLAYEPSPFGADDYVAPEGSRVPEVGPGKTLTVAGRDEEGSGVLELPCPDAVAITSPVAGTEVRAGETITVAWSGNAHPHRGGVYTAGIWFLAPDPDDGKWYAMWEGHPRPGYAEVPAGATSLEMIVPDLDVDEYVLELHVPGKEIQQDNGTFLGSHEGRCVLVSRVQLNVVP